MSEFFHLSARLAALSLSILVTSQFAQAAEYQKNGLPCVAEICVGDGLAEMAKVPWERAKLPFASLASKQTIYMSDEKVSQGRADLIRADYRGDLGKAMPYLDGKGFDAAALPALARVTAVCSSDQTLRGTYMSPSGHPTSVLISLTSYGGSTDQQRWMVTSISRDYPSAVSREQKDEIENELKSRYADFRRGNKRVRNSKPVPAQFSNTFGSVYGFQLTMFLGLEEGNRLKQHPLCGGSNKVKVD